MLALGDMQAKIHGTIYVKYFVLHLSIIETHNTCVCSGTCTHARKCAHTHIHWSQVRATDVYKELYVFECTQGKIYEPPNSSTYAHVCWQTQFASKYPRCIRKISLHFHHQILSTAVIKWLFASLYVFLQDCLCVNDCRIQESCRVYSQKALNK